MLKKQKGGIETIIAVIILTGIVIALILNSILPTVRGATKVTDGAVTRLDELDIKISGAEHTT